MRSVDHPNIIRNSFLKFTLKKRFGLILWDFSGWKIYSLCDGILFRRGSFYVIIEKEIFSRRFRVSHCLQIFYNLGKFYFWLYKLTSALAHIHSKKIIHRDMKMDNVLFLNKANGYKEAEPKIIDFGLSTFT